MKESPDQMFEPKGGWGEITVSLHRTNNELGYATGYREAAEILMEHAETRLHSLDVLVYPILFLYRHRFELVLKAIIRGAAQVLDETIKIPFHHPLMDLWETAKGLLSRIDSPSAVETLKKEVEILAAFDALDPNSTAFRYADTGALPSQTLISYKQIRDKLGRVELLLDGITSTLDYYLDNAAEAAAAAYEDRH